MSDYKFSRRALLAATGVPAALVPLLDARRKVWGAAPQYPKRLVILQWTNGVIHSVFWPTGSDSNFTLSEILAPLEPHKKDIVVIGGVTLQNMADDPVFGVRARTFGGHASLPYLLTGSIAAASMGADGDASAPGPLGNSISVDQYVANGIAATANLKFRSLVLSALFNDSHETGRSLSFTGPAVGAGMKWAAKDVVPEISPYRAFNSVFADVKSGDQTPDPAAAKLRARRKSVLDGVTRNLTVLRQKLGKEDQAKLDAHLSMVGQLEKEVTSTAGAAVGCQRPEPAAGVNIGDHGPVDKLFAMQMDIAIEALACDLTRVASVMLMGPHNNTVTFQFLGIDPKQPAIGGLGERSHHDIAHNPGPNQGEQKRIVDRWFVQLFADFLAKLKMRPEGSGTMLDNTLVVFVNNFSEGGSHSYTNLPFLLGGSCGGAIQTGRFVRANGWTPAKWGDNCIPHNGILVAITKAMGIAPPMMGGNEYFGDPRYGGVMPGLLA